MNEVMNTTMLSRIISTTDAPVEDYNPCSEPDILPTTSQFYNALGKFLLYTIFLINV